MACCHSRSARFNECCTAAADRARVVNSRGRHHGCQRAAAAANEEEEDERWVDVTEDVAGVAASLDVDELLRRRRSRSTTACPRWN